MTFFDSEERSNLYGLISDTVEDIFLKKYNLCAYCYIDDHSNPASDIICIVHERNSNSWSWRGRIKFSYYTITPPQLIADQLFIEYVFGHGNEIG